MRATLGAHDLPTIMTRFSGLSIQCMRLCTSAKRSSVDTSARSCAILGGDADTFQQRLDVVALGRGSFAEQA